MAGFRCAILGVTVSAALLELSGALLDLSDGVLTFVGLVAIASALAAHGALSASVLLRLSRLGWRRGLQDARVIAEVVYIQWKMRDELKETQIDWITNAFARTMALINELDRHQRLVRGPRRSHQA